MMYFDKKQMANLLLAIVIVLASILVFFQITTVKAATNANKNPVEGQAFKCIGDKATVYRYEDGTRRHYPSAAIANSWDTLWRKTANQIFDCSDITAGPPMSLKPKQPSAAVTKPTTVKPSASVPKEPKASNAPKVQDQTVVTPPSIPVPAPTPVPDPSPSPSPLPSSDPAPIPTPVPSPAPIPVPPPISPPDQIVVPSQEEEPSVDPPTERKASMCVVM
jgi:outer membrane biosynthesis protein TonB